MKSGHLYFKYNFPTCCIPIDPIFSVVDIVKRSYLILSYDGDCGDRDDDKKPHWHLLLSDQPTNTPIPSNALPSQIYIILLELHCPLDVKML